MAIHASPLLLSLSLSSRFIGGMGLGFNLSSVSVYIVEITTLDMRGLCGCMIQLFNSAGILFTFTGTE